MRVNLISRNGKNLSLNWKRIAITVLLFVLVFLMGLNYYISFLDLSALEIAIAGVENQLSLLNIKKKDLLEIEQKIKQLEAAKPNPEKKFEYFWTDVIREQGFIVVEDVTYNYIRIADGMINIEGVCRDYQTFLAIIKNFNSSPLFEQATTTELRQGTELAFKIEAKITAGGE